MNRRALLRLLSFLLLSRNTSARGGCRDQSTRRRGLRVLVIGAGLAGLAAAREITRQGHHVVVLEARDRIGGRIWTSTTWPDAPLDLGATWIHGVTGNPITDLADQLGARRLVTSYNRAVLYHTTGRLLSKAEAVQLDDIRTHVFAALRSVQASDSDRAVRQAVASVEQELAGHPAARRLLNFCLSSEIEQEYAGSADRLSAHWYDSAQEFDGDDALFARGFQIITEHLAQDVDVTLSQIVTEIRWQEPEVRVRTTHNEFTADRVVVTLPLGVLQHNQVRFVPELPEEKRTAISALGMGVLNKCYLRFPHAFWPHDVDWLEYIPAQHGEWTEWVSFRRAAQWPILLGFNSADRGHEIEAWSDEQIVASAMKTLTVIFGSTIPSPVDYQVTRWASDPFARGSYSYHPVGSTPAMRGALAQPLRKRLYFAGEATSTDYFGTAHGAYLSGVQAARDVLEE